MCRISVICFLVSILTCSESQLSDINQTILTKRENEYYTKSERSDESANLNERFIFTTNRLPNDSKRLPTLSNGHMGFTVLSDEVFLNGLYNGKKGLSHRARIPNFVNIFMEDCLRKSCNYTLDVKQGLFIVELVVKNQFVATHFIYAHRFYTRAVVNQIHIQRLEPFEDEIKIKLQRYPGIFESQAKNCKAWRKRKAQNNCNKKESFQKTSKFSDDLNFTVNKTVQIDGKSYNLLCGQINEPEIVQKPKKLKFNEWKYTWNKQQEDVCIVWNNIPEKLRLNRTLNSSSFKFVMTVDEEEINAVQEVMDIFRIPEKELLKKHTEQWEMFWNDLVIEGTESDNNELIRAIISSVFYLTSSLPSITSNLPQHLFYGLSPTGLGRGSTLDDYEGHSMWDSEMWMLPPAALIHPNWAKDILHYRFRMMDAARYYANASGYRGLRFPWESAATGIEVIQPGYEYIAKYQQHISADISFALKNYISISHDKEFLESEGCDLAIGIAEFWASRVNLNASTKLYDIRHVMGPDEDHSNVSNNLFTNLNAKNALNFGRFAKCICNKTVLNDEWLEIAKKITVLYDSELDYHPQFAGYKVGTAIKQADVILAGYPLMFSMNASTKLNDLKFYSDATRESGPAMSFSMYVINYLDVNDERNANKMLRRSFEPYIRKPFNVWSEVSEEENGATNFITGAGGFLQLIFNGFLGIRIHDINRLEILNPRLPGNYTAFTIKGMSYLKSKFQIEITTTTTLLKFHKLSDDLKIELKGKQLTSVVENWPYIIDPNTSAFVSSAVNPLKHCVKHSE